jgi:4-hydroxy-tetrahydrodipicolinate synthase
VTRSPTRRTSGADALATGGSDPKPIASRFLRGSITPVITPIKKDSVDYDTYERLVSRQIDLGSDGVVVTGTTGEPTTLRSAERLRLVRRARAVVPDDRWLIAATACDTVPHTIDLTNRAHEVGADAALIATPYFVRPSQRSLIAYYSEIAAAVELPILVYNIPARTGVAVEAGTMIRLFRDVPNIAGVKHSSADLSFVSDVISATDKDFSLFCGLEEATLPMLALGASGVMSAVGNVLPQEVAALCQSIHQNDLRAAQIGHYELLEISRSIFWDTNPVPLKYLMMRLGLISENSSRPPLLPAAPDLEARLDRLIDAHDLARRAASRSAQVSGLPMSPLGRAVDRTSERR